IICSPMTSLKTSIKTITYLSDIGCLEIQGASLHGTDIYGRMLGTIWLDGYDINASMVDSGYAWVYRFEDNAIVPGYIKYESAAQKEAKGLWADTNPVPPWQWRQANEKPRKVKEKK
ncbi:thermonuclease family protein, partial [Escherichia coli]|uniref:thermonuclease family protein n=1 Tax=Escherichia coli TaxID=562 RepID=UPI00207BEEDE